MKMLFALLGVLCLTGTTLAVAAGGDCTTDACDDDTLQCQDNICRVKIDANCQTTSTSGVGEQCPKTATACASDGGTCECPSGSVKNSPFECGLKIDQTGCTDDKPCITGADCNTVGSDKTCQCKAKSMKNTALDKCLMYVGETCSETADCVENGDCPASGEKKCGCANNYLASYDNSACKLAPTKTGCGGDNNKCGENAKCNTDTCECKEDKYTGTADQRCVLKDGETCSANSECKQDYTCENSKCSGAAAVMASMLLVLAAFVGTRWI